METDFKVRFLHNVPEAPQVNLVFGKKDFVVYNLAYQDLTEYFYLPQQRVQVRVVTSSGDKVLLETRASIRDNGTFVVTGNVSDLN